MWNIFFLFSFAVKISRYLRSFSSLPCVYCCVHVYVNGFLFNFKFVHSLLRSCWFLLLLLVDYFFALSISFTIRYRIDYTHTHMNIFMWWICYFYAMIAHTTKWQKNTTIQSPSICYSFSIISFFWFPIHSEVTLI